MNKQPTNPPTTPKRDVIAPFENEAQVIGIGELSLENRTDRVSLSGNVDLTRDVDGLALALTLKANLDAIVAKLQSEHLPEKISTASVKTVKNPFSR
jgi:hypothetical protein